MSEAQNIQKDKFIYNLKLAVIDACNVKNLKAEDIPNNEPIVGGKGKLQLDSLDALEIIMMVEQRFNLRLSGDESSRALFHSFDKMGTYLMEKAAPEKVSEFTSAN
jgi:acyl carrier protein